MVKINNQFILFLVMTILISLGTLPYLLGLQWFPLLNMTKDYALLVYLLTITVGKPGIAITIIVLSLITLRHYNRSFTCIAIFMSCLVGALSVAYITKHVIKEVVREERPYVVWLAEQNKIPQVSKFHAYNNTERRELVVEGLGDVSNNIVPYWLKNHWIQKVNFSFPSGHSIAAITLVAFFVPLLVHKAYPFRKIGVLVIWGILVCYSRLLLGLHWPLDILSSAVLGLVYGLIGAKVFILHNSRISSETM